MVEFIRKRYTFLVSLVGVLGTWNALAGSLDLPGPKVVSRELRELIVGRQVLAVYDIDLESSFSNVQMSTASPPPDLCFDNASVDLIAAPRRLEGPRLPAAFWAFAYPDVSGSHSTNGGSFEVVATTAPAELTLSFIVANPIGADSSITLDELTFLTTKRGSFPNGDYRLRTTWVRGPIVVPNTLPLLSLISFVGQDGATESATRLDTGRRDLDFDLQPGESVRVRVTLQLGDTGVYSLIPTVNGFYPGGTQFQSELSPVEFGWTRSSAGGFMAEDSIFSDRCFQ
jgi:hypothetical protein